MDKCFFNTIGSTLEELNVADNIAYTILNDTQINQVLNTAWSGKHYSERIYGTNSRIAERIKNDITDMVVMGKNTETIKKQLMSDLNVSYSYADRLVRTEASHTLTFSGVELKGLTSRRIVIPPAGEAYETFTKSSPEYIIANLLTNQLINPAAANRKIAGTLLEYTQSATKIRYDGRYQNLEEAIETLATTYNVGWCAYISDNVIKWKIWRGVDRTAAQTTNNRMILSYDYGTMNNSSLTFED